VEELDLVDVRAQELGHPAKEELEALGQRPRPVAEWRAVPELVWLEALVVSEE
jgi:hypothetical protein